MISLFYILAFSCTGLFSGTNAFFRPALGWVKIPTVSYFQHQRLLSPLASSNPDLFSDDLFGDDIMEMPKKKSKVTIPIQSKSQYLDQDWQLSEEDEKDNKGSGKKDSENQTASQPEVIYPCFALMYRLRKEYMDTTIEVAIADHNSYCLSATDKEDTRAEMKAFLEEDPLITKDMIEKWEIIDLEPKEEVDDDVDMNRLADSDEPAQDAPISSTSSSSVL